MTNHTSDDAEWKEIFEDALEAFRARVEPLRYVGIDVDDHVEALRLKLINSQVLERLRVDSDLDEHQIGALVLGLAHGDALRLDQEARQQRQRQGMRVLLHDLSDEDVQQRIQLLKTAMNLLFASEFKFGPEDRTWLAAAADPLELLKFLYEQELQQRVSWTNEWNVRNNPQNGAGRPRKPHGEFARLANDLVEGVELNSLLKVVAQLSNEFWNSRTTATKLRQLLNQARRFEA